MCLAGLAIVDWTASEVKQVFKLSSRGDGILSVTWSDNGSTLACLTKTSKLFVLDPRQRHASPKLLEATTGAAKEGKDAESGVIVQIDTGMKRPQRCMYVSKKNASTGRIMVLGINAQHRPAVHIFSSEASTLLAEAAPPHAPIAKETLSFSSGNMLSAYDEDSRLLFLCMRGSSQMVMYQVGDEETDAAFTLKQTQGGGYIDTGAEGFTLVHKSACDIHDSEVQRVYVIADRKLQVYRQIVPQRKKGLLESLFPDTRAYRSALSAADYFQGQNRPPVLESVEKLNGALQAVSLSPLLDDAQSVLSTSPQSGLDTKAAVISNAAATTKATPTNESLSTAGAPDIISPLASFQSHSRQRVNSRLAGSKYRHIQCAEPLQKSRCYHDLNNSEQNLLLYKNIHANTLFWATPWKTSGGSALAVFRVGEQADLGRTPLNKQDSGVLRMSSNLASFALSPLQPNLIATATVESIKVWELPTVGLNESNNSSDADREKLCRRTLQPEGKVNNIAFHPYISNLLVCSSNSFSGVHIEFFDVQEQQGRSNGDPLKASTIVDLPFLHSPNSGINQPVCDFDFHPDGGSVLCCSKDGTVSVVDPVNKSVKGPIHSAESKRICQCRWISPTRFLTIGFSGRGTRSISLWEYTNAVDAKAPEKPLFSHMMDTNSSWMIPHVDLERNLLLIINVGKPPEWRLHLFMHSLLSTEYLYVFECVQSMCASFNACSHLSMPFYRQAAVLRTFLRSNTGAIPSSTSQMFPSLALLPGSVYCQALAVM